MGIAHRTTPAGFATITLMRELWLVRHGETEWSRSGAHTGRTDIPLTDAGRANAAAVGRYLANRRFALVLVSPIHRPPQTSLIPGYSTPPIHPDLTDCDHA